jgi:hypothetical protein
VTAKLKLDFDSMTFVRKRHQPTDELEQSNRIMRLGICSGQVRSFFAGEASAIARSPHPPGHGQPKLLSSAFA